MARSKGGRASSHKLLLLDVTSLQPSYQNRKNLRKPSALISIVSSPPQDQNPTPLRHSPQLPPMTGLLDSPLAEPFSLLTTTSFLPFHWQLQQLQHYESILPTFPNLSIPWQQFNHKIFMSILRLHSIMSFYKIFQITHNDPESTPT